MSETETADAAEAGLSPFETPSAMPLGPLMFEPERLMQMEQQHADALAAANTEDAATNTSSKLVKPPDRAVKKPGTSKYRGVNLHRRSCRWDAHAWHERQVHLGCFDFEVQAAVAYDIAALKLKGNKAKLNFDIGNYTEEIKYVEGLTFAEVVAALRSSRRQLLNITRLKGLWPVYEPPTPASPIAASSPAPQAPPHHPSEQIKPRQRGFDKRRARSPSPVEEPQSKRARPGSRPSSPSNSNTSHNSLHCQSRANPNALSPASSPNAAAAHPPFATAPFTYLPAGYPPLFSAPHPAHPAYVHAAAPHPGAAPTLVYYAAPHPHGHPTPLLLPYASLHAEPHSQTAPYHPPATYVLSRPPANPPAASGKPGHPLSASASDAAYSASDAAYSASDSLLLQASRARAQRLRDSHPDPSNPNSDPPSNPAAAPHPAAAPLHQPYLMGLDSAGGHILLTHLPPHPAFHPPTADTAVSLPSYHPWPPTHPAATTVTRPSPPHGREFPSAAPGQDPRPTAAELHPSQPYIVVYPQAPSAAYEAHPQLQRTAAAAAKPLAGPYLPVQRLQLPANLRVL